MKKIKKYSYLSHNNQGFAIIAALMALLILTAVGALVFTVTTQDIRVSTRVVGEKKAFSAAQAGIHRLSEYSNSQAGIIPYSYTPANQVVDAGGDHTSIYSINNVTIPGVPASVKMAGYEAGGSGGSKQWGQTVTTKNVTGQNTRYNSRVSVDVGIGYGPVEISTGQPAAGG